MSRLSVTRAEMSLMHSQPTPDRHLDTLFAKASNLGEQVYEHLREQILSRQFPGGIELPEGRLAEHLQVSRTPMREALVRLVGEGLLERSAERAYRVREVSTREYFECMQLREILECYAIDQAIATVRDEDLSSLRAELRSLSDSIEDDMPHRRFENRFHSFFALTAGDATLADTITRMRVIARLFRISSRFHRKPEFDSEHLAIIEAVERRDASAAKAAMRAHLRNLQDAVRQAIAAEMNPRA
jgi:DNA-binding GntR family transcriptional regulator